MGSTIDGDEALDQMGAATCFREDVTVLGRRNSRVSLDGTTHHPKKES